MQNIPGIALEKATEQLKTVKISAVKDSDKQALFDQLFQEHSSLIEGELALSPVETKDKMLDTTSLVTEEKVNVNAANTKEVVKEDEPQAETKRDERMTQEEFDEVKDDLEEYGLSEQEIAEIEEKVNSDEGLTWDQFVSTVAHKMSEMRKVELSDDQKDKLSNFFAKLGFDAKQSARLMGQLENGEHGKVMNAIKAKIEAMPQNKQLLITKDEVEAFSAAMNFSKEFTSKIKEVFGQNTLTKDVKEAFTMIRQELADMDEKDRKLVKAVGKAFAKSTGKEIKETSVARDIEEAVDLKPRVAEDNNPKAMLKEDFKEAVETRKEGMTDANARKTDQKAVPQKAEADVSDQQQDRDSDDTWNNFFGKLREDNSTQSTRQFQIKTESVDNSLKTGLAETNSKTQAKAWEKVSAPKVMRQVENAFIKNLGNGTKQLTLQLTPENLGKLNIMLQVNGKEVSAVIRAESVDAAKVINENIEIIKNSLESQGLKVEKLDVQAGLTGNQGDQDWFGSEQHNMARDREAMAAMRSHMRAMRGDEGTVAQDMQSIHEQARNAEQGLHIVA